MGLRGPIAKSAEERQYDGNPAHRPLPPPRPDFASAGLMPRPRGMSAAQRRVWDEMVVPLGPLPVAQVFTLRDLCADIAKLQELERGQRQLVAKWKREAKAAGQKVTAPLAECIANDESFRNLERVMHSLKRHVSKMQVQSGLTLLAAQRLEGFGGFIPPAVGEALDPIEEQIQ